MRDRIRWIVLIASAFIITSAGYRFVTHWIGTARESAGTVEQLLVALDENVTEVRVGTASDESTAVFLIAKDGSRREYFIPEAFFPDVKQKIVEQNLSVVSAPPSELERDTSYIDWYSLFEIGFNLMALWFFWGFGPEILRFFRMNFGSYAPKRSDVRFKDVASIGDSLAQFQLLVDMLKHPDRFRKSGAEIPNGYLLVGPPGTGKTLHVEAIAGEAGVPVIVASGSDFVELFVGNGARRVRTMMRAAERLNEPCIIFIDEIDAIGRRRSVSASGGDMEYDQTLNALLTAMQGFQKREIPVIFIGATNRPEILDPALTRPGRLDRTIHVRMPIAEERTKILEVTVQKRKIKLAVDVDLQLLGRATSGLSGAQLAELINRATIVAAQSNAKEVTMAHLSDARDEIVSGTGGSVILFEGLRRTVGHHEAGHAVVAWELSQQRPDAPEVMSVSILRDAMSLGRVVYVPRTEEQPIDADFFRLFLAVLLGGRAGELVLGKAKSLDVMLDDESTLESGVITAGVEDDFNRAHEIAFKMVARWGMSRKLGLEVFIGKDDTLADLSPKRRELIEDEVAKIMKEALALAVETIEKQQELFRSITERLERQNILRLQDLSALTAATNRSSELQMVV